MPTFAPSARPVPLARPATHALGDDPGLVHLAWNLPPTPGAIMTVYVDGDFYDTATHPGQREMWLELDRSVVHRIELGAVDSARAAPSGATLSLGRDQRLPLDTAITFRVDGQVRDTVALWSDDTPRAGFGSLFAVGGFGIDAATGPGLGRGQLGRGPLGVDGQALALTADRLGPGEHALTASAADAGGRPVAQPVTVTVTTDPGPDPVASPTLAPDWTLRWRE